MMVECLAMISGRILLLAACLVLAWSPSFGQEEEPTAKAHKAGTEKGARKPLKKPPKDKESKYISPGQELGGPFRFDEFGRPLKGKSDEKGEEQAKEEGKDKPKKLKWPRKPGKRRPGTKGKKAKTPKPEATEEGVETPPDSPPSGDESAAGGEETPPKAEEPAAGNDSAEKGTPPAGGEEPPPESPPAEENPE